MIQLFYNAEYQKIKIADIMAHGITVQPKALLNMLQKIQVEQELQTLIELICSLTIYLYQDMLADFMEQLYFLFSLLSHKKYLIIQSVYNKLMGACAGNTNPKSAHQTAYQSVIQKKKCKILKCDQDHSCHYCKKCKNADSDHFSSQCTLVITNADGSLIHCKVQKCQQNHQKHYCTICANKDSDHFARECPEAMVLFHGTTQNVVPNIKSQGFKQSASGCRGKGVYFTDQKQVAAQIANYRQGQRNVGEGVVIKCVVPKNFKPNQDRGQHAKWNGVTNSPFQQFVVRDPKKIRIVQIQKA